MHDCHINQSWYRGTGTQRWYRVQPRRHPGKHDVDVLKYRRRLVDGRDAVDGLRVGRVVHLDAPPVVASGAAVAQAETVQVYRSLEH